MLIHQDSLRESAVEGAQSEASGTAVMPKGQVPVISEDDKAKLWDRIVRVHFLAADLIEPGLAPHLNNELTRFVAGALKEWAQHAEEGLAAANQP